MKLIVLAGLLALAVALPKNANVSFRKDAHPDIINGKEAEPHSIPYQVWLTISDSTGSGWYCGGTLISKNYVLTAGHCTYEARSGTVLLGAHNIKKKEDTQVTIKAKRLIPHEKFNINKIAWDIGLIELATPVEETDAIKIASLPTLSDVENDLEGVIARVSGWGLTKGTANTVSSILMEEEDTIISNDECMDYFGADIHDYNICLSADSGRGSCNGDSGGPLEANDKIVGIVSFGIAQCKTGYPSAFTRVTSFLQWIEDNSDVKIQQ